MEKPKSQQQLVNEQTRSRLNEVSQSFCLAKWFQSTVHLHRGLTHSCHHTQAHEIPITELNGNFAALHNTREKISSRHKMLIGERPKECAYCWNIEDLGDKHFSDRIFKSQDSWAMPNMDDLLKAPLSNNIIPKYLEISFSRACNFRCSYCSPAFSSKWAQDIIKDGAYTGRLYEQTNDLLHEKYTAENNPYIEAFWKWWPILRENLHTFRLTGGEPLLSNHTFRLLDEINQLPAPNLNLFINSNLGHGEAIIRKFIDKVVPLCAENKVKSFELLTSLEAVGNKAEYIRDGLNEKQFWQNLEQTLREVPNIRVTIMSTFNALSLSSYKEMLERVLHLREKYPNKKYSCPLIVDTSYLRYPQSLAVNILTPDFEQSLEDTILFVEKNRSSNIKKAFGFFPFEQFKLERTLEWMKIKPEPNSLNKFRAQFFKFFSEHDIRRGTNFLATFPEYSAFWALCGEAFRGFDQPLD